LETNDTSGSTGGKFLFELDGESLWVIAARNWSTLVSTLADGAKSASSARVGWSTATLLTEDATGELLVVNATALVSIVDAEEHFQVLSGWDLDADLLNGFGELIWLDNTIVVKIEVFERFQEHLLLGLGAARFL